MIVNLLQFKDINRGDLKLFGYYVFYTLNLFRIHNVLRKGENYISK